MQQRPPSPVPSTQIAVRCKSTGRLSFRADEQGVWMFCRQHNMQHLITWDALHLLQTRIQEGTSNQNIYI